MPELERALLQLGSGLELPVTPDLASAVRGRLGERRSWRRPMAIALAVLVVAIGAILAVPPARTAILDWLGLSGVKIIRVEKLPPAPAVGNLRLGRELSLSEAQARAPWLVVPKERPDHVYYSTRLPGGQVSLLWGTPTSVRLLLTEFRGEAFLGKIVEEGTKLEPVEVDGSPGVWVAGRHVLVYRDQAGEVRSETARLAGKTLIWQHGELTARLEGDLSKDDALRIARSVR